MTTIETTTVNGFTVEIHYDQDAGSPRDDYHGAELVLSHKRYTMPNDAAIDFDSFGGWGEIRDYLLDTDALATVPVYMYEHSGIALRAGEPFSDPWDSGVLGLAYVTLQNWKDAQGDVEWTGSDDQLKIAHELMTSDVENYGQYLNGDVYGYMIIDPLDGEEVQSLWGMYGFDTAMEEAKAAAMSAVHERKCTGQLNRSTGKVEHTQSCPFHGGEAS